MNKAGRQYGCQRHAAKISRIYKKGKGKEFIPIWIYEGRGEIVKELLHNDREQ